MKFTFGIRPRCSLVVAGEEGGGECSSPSASGVRPPAGARRSPRRPARSGCRVRRASWRPRRRRRPPRRDPAGRRRRGALPRRHPSRARGGGRRAAIEPLASTTRITSAETATAADRRHGRGGVAPAPAPARSAARSVGSAATGSPGSAGRASISRRGCRRVLGPRESRRRARGARLRRAAPLPQGVPADAARRPGCARGSRPGACLASTAARRRCPRPVAGLRRGVAAAARARAGRRSEIRGGLPGRRGRLGAAVGAASGRARRPTHPWCRPHRRVRRRGGRIPAGRCGVVGVRGIVRLSGWDGGSRLVKARCDQSMHRAQHRSTDSLPSDGGGARGSCVGGA